MHEKEQKNGVESVKMSLPEFTLHVGGWWLRAKLTFEFRV